MATRRRDIREQLAQALAREHDLTTAHLSIGELVDLALARGLSPRDSAPAERATRTPTDERSV